MRQPQFGILLVTGFIWLGVSIEAIAQTVPSLDKSKSIGRILRKSQATRELPLLSKVKRPLTSAQLLVQSPTPEIVQVTAVEANPTEQGVEVVLQTTMGEQLTVVNRSSGNSYIADIPNAQLRLPNGEVFGFRAQKPIAGITQITVTNANANTIRVTVTGAAGVPTVELFDSDKEGLIFGVVRVAALQGQQPQTPTPQGVEPGSEAQPNEPLAEGQEEIEITVTATRTEEKPQDVPRSLTIINREQIAEQAQSTRDLGNILGKLVPGLSPPTQSSSSFGQTLRGRNVLVLIDGVPQSTSRNVFRDFSTIDPSAVERIEVLRGPTAIYGDGATGGVVNIITRTASEEKLTSTTEVGLSASLSHLNDSFGYNLRHSISGTDNNFDYTISAALAGVGGFFDADGDRIAPDPNGQGGLSDTDTFNILGKVGVNIGEGQRLQLTLNHFNDRQNTDFTTDPSVNRLPGRQKARALEGLDLEDNQGTRNTLINLEYNNEDLLGSRVRTQAYYRNYFTRFFPFDAQNIASLGNIIFQSQLQSEKIGSRLEIDTPLSSPETLSLLWGVDLSRENSSQPVAVFYTQHGKSGDGCWVGELCHKRRTYYKKRDLYNRNRRLKYRSDRESAKQLESIAIPTIAAVIVYFYRGRKDEPLHAMSVELWVGQQKKDSREPVHTLGWKEANVREYITSAMVAERTAVGEASRREGIASFSKRYDISISGVAATVELKPNLCPLAFCPLKVGGDY